jgi:hypothetical protein
LSAHLANPLNGSHKLRVLASPSPIRETSDS